ncbi:AAA family ATPase [Aquisediminimonas profunda]|uniref:AAA family ATPase n=1 Tax=Aquisediminimonas profunda TaxID=1550733 RepID=UPI001C638CD9|nr:AAA family ATPase [Aquisediminimonas profunda]
MNNLVGHDGVLAEFLTAMRGPRMHHAWLLVGPEGVGKARTAMALAKRLLCEASDPDLSREGLAVPANHAIGRLFDAHTHPDFIQLERLPKDIKVLREIERANWPADLERARNITIEQVRSLGSTFALKPSYSRSRVVLVDAIDDMERGAANALLKSLEEPPHGTIFLLVSHAPGRLLPTIRSRCRTLRFAALDQVSMEVALRSAMPGITDSELTALVKAGEGSPGKALSFAGLDLAGMDADLRQIAQDGDPDNRIRSELAQSLSAKPSQRRYEAFLSRAPSFIAEEARERHGAGLKAAVDAWSAARGLAESAIRQSLDPQMTVFALAGHVAALVPGAKNAKA